MKIIDIIEKKKQGNALNEEEIRFFINGVTEGTIEDYQTSALLMAIYFQGMNTDEITYLTKYMAESGETLNLEDISKDVTDKHSTGGVGDKITIIMLPILAAAGVYSAKLSGRGLGHTGGTIDKLESIPGFRTDLSIEEFKSKVKEHKAAIAAQTLSLAPADGKLYALRDVTSTVDIIPLIASSVVSKKIASGANHIILDVRAVGNSIEIIEVMEFLKGNKENDLKEITYTLCREALKKNGKVKSKEESDNYIDELISSGKALEKFREIIKSQNGDERITENYNLLPQAKIKYEVKSVKSGYITNIDALNIAKACKNLGAGREKKTDSIDYSAGIYLNKRTSERIQAGETIATIYTNKQSAIKEAEELILSAVQTGSEPPKTRPLVYKVIN